MITSSRDWLPGLLMLRISWCSPDRRQGGISVLAKMPPDTGKTVTGRDTLIAFDRSIRSVPHSADFLFVQWAKLCTLASRQVLESLSTAAASATAIDQDRLDPQYTAGWDELPIVRA